MVIASQQLAANPAARGGDRHRDDLRARAAEHGRGAARARRAIGRPLPARARRFARYVTQPLFGRAYDPPLRAMREYLDADGRPAALPGAPAGPATVCRPRVLAALGPKMLALARDSAMGAHPTSCRPSTRGWRARSRARSLAVSRGEVVFEDRPERARALGRAAGAVNIALPNISARVARARSSTTRTSRTALGRLIDATIAWGDASAISKYLDRHFEAGATQVCIMPSAREGSRRPGLEGARSARARAARMKPDTRGSDRVAVLGRLPADRERRNLGGPLGA